MNSLPTLRRKIFKSFTTMIVLYAGLGAFLMVSVFSASRSTPKLLHVNYDSIAAAREMKESWNALKDPRAYPAFSREEWKGKFEKGLVAEEKNITEPGEAELARALRSEWEIQKNSASPPDDARFIRVDRLLSRVVRVNEQAMFRVAQANTTWSHVVLGGALVYLILTLVLGVFLADGLSNRLSSPIKSIAEAIHRRPELGKKLKLIEPSSLEILILSTEIKRLWERVSESERINIRDLIARKNRIEAVLDSVEDGLLVLDSDEKVLHMNATLLSLLGLKDEEVTGHFWDDLPTPRDNYLRLRRVLKPEMRPEEEVELDVNGKPRTFSVRLRKASPRTGESAGVIYLLRDITAKRETGVLG